MKYLLAIAALSLAGCSSVVPVTMKFPDIPEDLKVSCEKLEKIPADTVQLSVTSESVIRNYGRYHKCSEKVDAWLEWHRTQKQIYENVK